MLLMRSVPGDRTHTAVTYAKGPLTRSINRVLDGVYRDVNARLDREIGRDGEHCPVHSREEYLLIRGYVKALWSLYNH